MGGIFSRFTKKYSSLEKLEEIDKEVRSCEKTRARYLTLERKLIFRIFLLSFVIFLILLYYALRRWYNNDNWKDLIIACVFPFLLPFVSYIVVRAFRMLFGYMLARCNAELTLLNDKKRTILDEVKEKEPYMKAREILERFDPDSDDLPMKSPESGLRKRVSGVVNAVKSTEKKLPVSDTKITSSMQSPTQMSNKKPISHMQASVKGQMPIKEADNRTVSLTPVRPPVRPFPTRPEDRSITERLMDVIVGDGPSNRYALICRKCYGHNGMALAEEFKFLPYHCCYCGFFNPSKCSRPDPPNIGFNTSGLSRDSSVGPSSQALSGDLQNDNPHIAHKLQEFTHKTPNVESSKGSNSSKAEKNDVIFSSE